MSDQTVYINGEDIQDMVRHHVGCPPNGYLGSPYGTDVKSMIQTPMASGNADAFVAKMKSDLPVIGLSGADTNIYLTDDAPDKKHLIIDVSGQLVIAGE